MAGRDRHGDGRGGAHASPPAPGPAERSAYSPTAGLPFDDEKLESKLVWIYGSPRTGSTWLLEMLCHPLKINSEPPVGFRWPESWRGRAPALPVDEFLFSAHVVPSQGRTVEIDGKLMPQTLNGLLERRKPSYAFSNDFADVWRPELRRSALVRLHAVIERAGEAGLGLATQTPVMVIKEVNGSHAANRVMPLFPRSKMLFLVRDGRDVLDSLMDASKPGGWLGGDQGLEPLRDPDDRREWVRAICRRWVASMDVCAKAFEAHPPELRRQIHYEDLLADTPGTLKGLLEWIGIPAGEGRLQTIAGKHAFAALPDWGKGAGQFRRSATPGKWREGLTPEEQELALEIMGSRLVELGYETDSDA